MDVVVAIPVKPFGAAKRRLSEVLSTAARRHLGARLAEHTAAAAAGSGGRPLILSADDEVTAWATARGLDVLLDEGSSLDAAAAGAVAWASDRGAGWIVCHADLPLVEPGDLRPLVEAVAAGRTCIAPSSDGGTSAVGAGWPRFDFAYGPASFHRHLATLAGSGPEVVVRTGLLLDLDRPDDLAAAARHPSGAWLPA
jgi:2-phospho-L-lactate guanylyltransferase